MIGLDTDTLVRFLVRDDEEQHRAVVAALRRGVEAGETFFVGDVVLAEVCWVLTSRYRCGREELAAMIRVGKPERPVRGQPRGQTLAAGDQATLDSDAGVGRRGRSLMPSFAGERRTAARNDGSRRTFGWMWAKLDEARTALSSPEHWNQAVFLAIAGPWHEQDT